MVDKKIVVVGNYKWDFYEKALVDGFLANSIKATQYIIKDMSLKDKVLNFNKLKIINKKFINEMINKKPDAIFLYRTNEIFQKSLQQIKKKLPYIRILIFHNDNPYIGVKNKLKYYLFLSCLKVADIVYVYRPSNLNDVQKFGVYNPKLLYPHFYSKNDLVEQINFSIKKYDVIFIGHYEKNRAKSINYLIKRGVNVNIFGSFNDWSKMKKKYNWQNDVINPAVFGSLYKKTLSEAKLALCFLSKINRDVYTRRNFEIPAAGTLAVSEYTKELSKIFKDDKEILLFKNNEELYNKIIDILNSQQKLEEKTLASYKKLKYSGHSEKDRAKQILIDLRF